MLAPIAIWAFRRRRLLLGTPFYPLAFVWLAGCAYAFLSAIVHRQTFAGLYGLSECALPIVVGAWYLERRFGLEAYERLARTLLIFGGIAGAYGVFQYVFAPPWDTAWMQNVAAESFGQPLPFEIRPFSVLNAPGPFANFEA